MFLLTAACLAQSFSVSGNIGASGNTQVVEQGAGTGGEPPPVEGVTVTQLTTDEGTDDGAAIAYYDTPAYNGTKIMMGRGTQLTASAFDWKPWTMDLDGTNKEKLSTVRIFDPWGWTPDGDRIYFRKNGLAIMDPAGGTSGNRPWATEISGVVSGNLCKVGANLIAVYEKPAILNEICAYTSTDSGDSFSQTECYTLSDSWPAASFHRVRASCVDNDTDGLPDFIHYKKTGSNTAIVFDTRDNSSYGYTWDDPGNGVLAVQDLSHPDVMGPEATMYGAWLTFGLGSDGVGYIYPFNLDTGLAGTAMNLPRWSNWNYRAASVHSETNQIALSKSTGGSEFGLYDRTGQALVYAYVWPNEPVVPYWSEVVAQMAATNTIIMRAPDASGVPQIYKAVYVP